LRIGRTPASSDDAGWVVVVEVEELDVEVD